MDLVEFVGSLYLGDRRCMKIVLDGTNRTVSIQVDTISRVRSPDGRWNFHSDEDIDRGYIVITDVSSIDWNESQRMPNDYIGYLRAEMRNDGRYLISFSADSVDEDGSNHEVVLRVVASDMFLADPARPGVEIRD